MIGHPDQTDDMFLKFLDICFYGKMSVKERLKYLRETFGGDLDTDTDLEKKVEDMCSLSADMQRIWSEEAMLKGIEIGQERGIEIGQERGIEIGQERGIEIGQERGILKAVLSLLSEGSITLETACRQSGKTAAQLSELLKDPDSYLN